MREHAAEKQRIARHVASSIHDGDSLMMDTGTTTSVLARELLGKAGLTVVTNSSDVARTLATVEGNRVYLAGGEVHGDNGAAFGGAAVAFLAGFQVRHAIISIAALSAGAGLMDYRLAEAEVARTVLGCGENRLVITDHTKFNRSALVRVAGYSEFDLLVTDRPPPPDIAAALAKGGARVEIAGGSD
jgi:DeoR family glycerol-3-phosphate regulon repressor